MNMGEETTSYSLTTKTTDQWNGPKLLVQTLESCSTLLFRPGSKTDTRSNSESMLALATYSLDKNNLSISPRDS